jgi:hypothetical protein
MARTHAYARARVCPVKRRVNGGPRKRRTLSVHTQSKQASALLQPSSRVAAVIFPTPASHARTRHTHVSTRTPAKQQHHAAVPTTHATQRTRGSGVAQRPSGEMGVPAGAPSTMTAGRMTSALPCACTFTRKLLR